MQSRIFDSVLLPLLIGVLLCADVSGGIAQTGSATRVPMETQAEALGRMSADQATRFQGAVKLFSSGDFAGALVPLRQLLTELPGEPIVSKYAAEAALNTGDSAYALGLVSAVLHSNEEDWQAHTLRVRLAAQSGDAATRDAEIARLADLRAKGVVPLGLRQYPVERVKVGEGSLLIFQSLFPWGNYKVRNYAQLFDGSGKLDMRMTLESSDFDQPQFAKEHPDAAAKGERRYSYDGYRDGGTNAQGLHTETHMTFGFVDKQPTYDEVRARFLLIAGGGNKAGSSNTHPIP
ncbi:hypothetical protein BH10ACI4_BH10ACI4_12340 [soil metagenome]